MNKKTLCSRTFAPVLTAILFTAASLLFTTANAQTTTPTADANHAALQMAPGQDHIRAGSDVALKLKLNDPLPEGARLTAYLSSVQVNESVIASSGEATNRERTEFTLRTKMPEGALPGEWHVTAVYFYLAQPDTAYSAVQINDLHFVVDGHKPVLPSSATVTLLSDEHGR